MRALELEDLHIFRTVVQEGGIARASEKLNRVPSSVTTHIKQLEGRLAARLFSREGRQLKLTEQGRILLVHAERLLHQAEVAENDVRDGIHKGTLRLGALESTAGARLPAILSAFHGRFPGMSIELKTGTTDSLVDRIRRYQLDAAFIAQPFEAEELKTRAVFQEELVLISPVSSPVIDQPAALNGGTIVVFPRGCSYRRTLQRWLSEQGASPSRILEFESYHAIVACVAAGTGVGIISSSLLATTTQAKSVRTHPLPSEIGRNTTHLVWKGEPSPQLRAFMDLLPVDPLR